MRGLHLVGVADDVVDLEDHLDDLRGQAKLVALAAERLVHLRVEHVRVALVALRQRVHAEPRVPRLDPLSLHLRHGLDIENCYGYRTTEILFLRQKTFSNSDYLQLQANL